MDDTSHSVLSLSTGTLSQNEVGILLKWTRAELKKKIMFRERFSNVIYDFSFFEHPWLLEMKFLTCSEHILGPLHLKILQLY